MEEKEITTFANALGAKEIYPFFVRHHYFLLNNRPTIIKISRNDEPFFGVGKKFIDLFGFLEDYLLVLLVNENDGWVYDKNAVKNCIDNGRWKLSCKDNEYKINHNKLKSSHEFNGIQQFLAKIQ